jgi:hypothetical protein
VNRRGVSERGSVTGPRRFEIRLQTGRNESLDSRRPPSERRFSEDPQPEGPSASLLPHRATSRRWAERQD